MQNGGHAGCLQIIFVSPKRNTTAGFSYQGSLTHATEADHGNTELLVRPHLPSVFLNFVKLKQKHENIEKDKGVLRNQGIKRTTKGMGFYRKMNLFAFGNLSPTATLRSPFSEPGAC